MQNILIVGTGALGTLFAARLAASGCKVTVLGTWKNAIDALNRDGARLVQSDRAAISAPVRAIFDPSECGDVGLALVLVKAWQTERAARQLEQCLSVAGLALTLQNGLGNRETLSGYLGSERVALGVTTTGATLLEPGLVRAAGEGLISLEQFPGSGQLRDLFMTAGLYTEVVADARALIWGKLVINAAINPLTALLGVPNGALLEQPSSHALMAALARETAAVASALGVVLPFADPVVAVEEVAKRTAANRSSMFQDIKRGAPTEIDAICGAVVHAGQSCGLPVPVNWTMWHLVKSLEVNAVEGA